VKTWTTILLMLALATTAVRADSVTYTYDDAGRLTSATYANGTVITYTYDAAGNLTARTVTAPASSSAKPAPKQKAEEKAAKH